MKKGRPLRWNGNREAMRQAEEAYKKIKGTRKKKKQKEKPKPVSRWDFPSYQAYLESPWWKHRRKTKLRQVGKKCEKCGNPSKLQVHHLSYEHVGNEKDSELQVLCKVCHKASHQIEWDKIDHLKSIMNES